MAIPDFQSLMLPVLAALAKGETGRADLHRRVSERLKLTEEDLAERQPSGRESLFANRVDWANFSMQRAGLIGKPRKGRYRLTEAGRTLLNERPEKIDLRTLNRFPSYVEWRRGGKQAAFVEGPERIEPNITPAEQIAESYELLARALASDLLERVRQTSWAFFETLVVDLLIKLNYGGGDPAMGKAIGRSGDEGVDGVISEDALGLDKIYVQAKRYAAGNTVGRPEVQAFAGALDGVGATKGILITTSSFSTAAREFASKIAKHLVLIDGEELARLMIEREVGVRVSATYKLMSIDENYFVE